MSVLPDERFERSADDLVVQVHILFTDAILGGDIKVPVLDASGDDVTVTVQIPPGTQHGASIRLPGHGIHRWHQGGRGSLNVVIACGRAGEIRPRPGARGRAERGATRRGARRAAGVAPGRAGSPPQASTSGAPSAAAVQAEQDAKVRLLDSLPLRRSDEFG